MQLNFNATNVDITNRFEALPAGEYLVMITDSQEKATKAGTGSYCELTLEVQAGDLQGRRLWDRLNLTNPSIKAVEIAQRQLAQICHAVGIMAPQQSAELHNKPLVAIVVVETGDRGLSNIVKGYKPAPNAGQHAAALPAPAAPRTSAQPPRAAAPAMPWATAKA